MNTPPLAEALKRLLPNNSGIKIRRTNLTDNPKWKSIATNTSSKRSSMKKSSAAKQ